MFVCSHLDYRTPAPADVMPYNPIAHDPILPPLPDTNRSTLTLHTYVDACKC